jgi:uncharacterized protein (TIGR03790 family)
MQRALSIALVAAALAPSIARAVPAPDSVAVLANASVPGSVALAMRYAQERSIPDGQVCILPMPATEDVSLDDFRAQIQMPLEACLGAAIDRIEAVVVIRGVPLRVAFDAGGARNVSLAAALALWRTTTSDGMPLLGQDPARVVDCGGTPCLAAAWRNAYQAGPFHAGWSSTQPGVVHRPVLVTMLHGRSDEDAERLLDSALDAEGSGATGEFLFMNGADAARGALDAEYAGVIALLEARGMTTARVPFDPDLSRRTLAGFFTGTAALGTTIEGNTYLPGSLVDNLTSFGAVPENFRASGESQVSIARWAARGVAGVHGTTAEPLNNCFPSRRLMVDWVDGATLAEAYFGRMPFVYWMNLVLGDPMAAPYAQRPAVAIGGLGDGEVVVGARRITVSAAPASGRVLDSIILYADGVEVARSNGEPIEHCLVLEEGTAQQVLAVASVAEELEPGSRWAARGWASVRVDAQSGATECAPEVDAAVLPDAGADAGAAMPPAGGCACRAGGAGGGGGIGIALALAVLGRRRDRSARARNQGDRGGTA